MGSIQRQLTSPFAALIEEHRSRRPAMMLRDYYKLLYQGIRGPEHLLSSAEVFTQRLSQEWLSLNPSQDDPLLEAIRPDGSLLRLNLRPYKAAGGPWDGLVTGCLEAGRCVWGTQADLQYAWAEFLALLRAGNLPGLPPEDCEAFTAWLHGNNFPPVHHSEQYRRLYRPAYRLVRKSPLWSKIQYPPE